MNGRRREMLAIGIMAVLALTPSALSGQQSADRDADVRSRLVGAYRLISYVTWDEDGDQTTTSFTEGTIMYDPSGRMGVHLRHRDRGVTGGQDLSDSDRADLYSSYIAYYGAFSINAEEGYVTHDVEGGLSPALRGREMRRYYDISHDGRNLILQVRDGDRVLGEVTWERYR